MIKQPTFVEPMPCRPIAPAETPRCLALEGPLVKIKGRSPKPMFFLLYPIYIYYIRLVVLTILKNMKVNGKDYPIYLIIMENKNA
jgi:hypothetical protein